MHSQLNDFIVVELLYQKSDENIHRDIELFKNMEGVTRVTQNKKIQAKLYSADNGEFIKEDKDKRQLKGANGGQKLSEIFNLEKYHSQNIKGKGIKIAIFDSGISEVFSKDHDYSDSDFLRVKKIINFTHEPTSKDSVGHGTFIASVVGS